MTPLLYADELTYGTALKQTPRTRRLNFGDEYSQRSRDGINSVPQSWQLQWKDIDNAKAEELRVFFEGLGGVDLISWTPFNQTVELKWTAGDFGSEPTGATTSSCAVTLTQEFDLT